MKCAIQLIFSDKDQSSISELRSILTNSGVHDEAVPINHISLADIEIDDNQLTTVRSILEKFSESHKSLNLVLSSAGSFMSQENVLFLTPTMTEELMSYNDELVNILTKNNIHCGRYYTKNNWQPHCTISIRLTDNELFSGFKILKEHNILPMQVTANAIDLLCYDPKPYKELIRFNLK